MASPVIKEIGVRNVECGERVTIVQPANLYDCVLGDDVFVGPFVEIQNDVVIGDRCRIQSHAFICAKVRIGSDCFISHGAKFVNDLFSRGGPAKGDKSLWKSTLLGNHISIGTNATVLPVEICDNVVVGAGAVVTRSLLQPGIYVGNPARLLRTLPRTQYPTS